MTRGRTIKGAKSKGEKKSKIFLDFVFDLCYLALGATKQTGTTGAPLHYKMNTMKLSKQVEYKLAEFSASPLGHAIHKDGAAAEYDGKPVMMYPAPDSAAPNQAFLKKNGELGFYTASGKKMGAEVGPRQNKFVVPLAIFTANNNNLAEVKANATDAEKAAVRKANAAVILNRVLGTATVKFGGAPATTRKEKLSTAEIKAAAKAQGIKLTDLDALMEFSMNPENTFRTVDVPEIKPTETTLAALAKQNPQGNWEPTPAELGEAIQNIASTLRDSIRLVEPQA